jgi:hypothetical protein
MVTNCDLFHLHLTEISLFLMCYWPLATNAPCMNVLPLIPHLPLLLPGLLQQMNRNITKRNASAL